MEDIIVRIGDLFSNLIVPGQKSWKTKSNSDIQKFVTNEVKVLTGIEVPHRDFRSIVQTFVNKAKKNNRRIELDKVLADWFNRSFSFKVEVSSVKNLGLTTNSEPSPDFCSSPETFSWIESLTTMATKTGN